jgi:hypothetical protein
MRLSLFPFEGATAVIFLASPMDCALSAARWNAEFVPSCLSHRPATVEVYVGKPIAWVAKNYSLVEREIRRQLISPVLLN